MASVNKVILVGNLGADPEVRYTQGGDAICNVRIATTDTWKDKGTGEKKEATEWHRVSFFGKLAEIAGQYLKKGRSVYVEGSLHTRKWQDKEGRDQYTTEIRATSMQMLGGRDGDAPNSREQIDKPAQSRTAAKPAAAAQSGGGSHFDDFDDDIPFVSSLDAADPMLRGLFVKF